MAWDNAIWKQFETYVSGESENKSRWENTTMDMGWDGSKNGRTKTASSWSSIMAYQVDVEIPWFP